MMLTLRSVKKAGVRRQVVLVSGLLGGVDVEIHLICITHSLSLIRKGLRRANQLEMDLILSQEALWL
jgi:hypothetical protein